ncbi:Uncharacterized protein FWK35_00008877 [Aphis craccivora]|uniref:Uncharacterized protein n=1 Tax=Aphis craccivora TaxID=307492 RepID=A0A6G0YRN2_APHCR|nr:Uncharacterized protein FWK35_00008877 [Aphis craccivora]
MCSKNELGRPIIIPFVIYADFECILKPKQTNEFTENSKKFQVSKIYITHLHEVMSYAFYIKVDNNIISEKGIDASKKCMENINDISKKKKKDIYQMNTPMITLTEKEEKKIQIAKVCKICLISFEENYLYKVRDRCHITGKYRQCICFKCNFEITNLSFVPRLLRDLSHEKGFFLMKYIEYIDIWSKLNETRLPSKSAFYNSLKDEEINNNNYSHAMKIWKVFNIKSLGEYSDLYLKSDVTIYD